MIRSELRTMLRGMLQDAGDNWSDIQLNVLLNAGLAYMQGEVVTSQPQAFVAYYSMNVTSGLSRYAWPPAAWRIDRLWMRQNATASLVPLKKVPNYMIDDMEAGVYSITLIDSSIYSIDGRFVRIYPTPTFTTAGVLPGDVFGLQFRGIPSLSMALDADTPEIHFALHPGICFAAKLIALQDTGEPANQTMEVLKDSYINKIPSLYASLDQEPDRFIADVDKSEFGL